MVAQQLTPELTQPNVLVEIDHGPPMGQQCVRRTAPEKPSAQMHDTMSSFKEASISKSSCRGPDPESTKSIDMESAGMRTEVLGVGSVECTENVLTFHRHKEGQGVRMELPRRVQNSWSPMTGLASFRSVGSPGIRVVRLAPSEREYQVPFTLHSIFGLLTPEYVALSHTWGDANSDLGVDRVIACQRDAAKSPGYGWCHPEEVGVVDKTMPFPDGLRKHSVAMLNEPEKKRRVLRPCLMTKSSGDVGAHPGEARQRALFDTHSANLADTALRDKLESVTEPVSIARISGSVSTMTGCRTLPTPLKHQKVLSKEFVEGEGNEKWMAEADNSDVLGGKPRHHLHYNLPKRIAPASEMQRDLGFRGDTYRPLFSKKTTKVADLWLDFCVTTVHCIQATVECLSDREQTRPRDIPHGSGYFTDLAEQLQYRWHYNIPKRDISSGRLSASQSSKKKDAMCVESPSFISCAAGSKKSFEVEPEEIAREVFMWMIGYNLMTSHCEKQTLVALAHHSLGQLLTVMEAAASCLHILLPKQLERNARDKQCTGEVHCLLDDPELKSEPKLLTPNPPTRPQRRAHRGPGTMESYTDFAPCNMALDNIDPAEIEEMLQQIQWEESMNQQVFAAPEYQTTDLDPSLSPLSGYASPSSMTTGSTNQSPLVPLLDYDMSFPMAPTTEYPESLFPELMDHSINMDPDWVGSTTEGYMDPFVTSDDAQVKASSLYPTDSHLYTTAAPDTTIYNSMSAVNPYATAQPPLATAQTTQPTPEESSSSSQKTTSPHLTCSHCGAIFTDKTKLKVHTNKHTKPFRCTAAGCDYATAEKKSLQRHLLAKSKWDEEHRATARSEGVRQVRHRCPREGCTYSTVREDNLKRHMNTCAQ